MQLIESCLVVLGEVLSAKVDLAHKSNYPAGKESFFLLLFGGTLVSQEWSAAINRRNGVHKGKLMDIVARMRNFALLVSFFSS